MIKKQFFDEKQNKNAKKVYVNIKQQFLRSTCPTNPYVTCYKLQRYGENIGDEKLLVEHTLMKSLKARQ